MNLFHLFLGFFTDKNDIVLTLIVNFSDYKFYDICIIYYI